MKRTSKIWLLSGLTLVTIGTIGINNIDSEALLKSNVSSRVQAYNHNESNMLDNVFEKNGLTILPVIFKDSVQTISKEYVVEQFKKAGLSIQNESNLPEIIGTGTEIKTASKIYTIIIYGDVNADGYVDVFDSQKIMRHYVYGGNNTLTGVYEIAGNSNNSDTEVDVFDAQRILRFYVGFETKLVVNEPTSLKEMDTEAPVITLKGSNPQTVRLGDGYVEAGATVSDNVDKNLVASIDSSKVNVNKVGTYTVTYTATDKSGNKTTITRSVKVVDYVTSITVTPPTKTTYKYREEINLSGMVVKANMKSGTSISLDSSKYQLSGYNKNQLGDQTVNVSYAGKTESFNVKVNDYELGIIIKAPTKTTYLYNEELDLTGATVTIEMASGAKGEEKDITYDMISVYDKETLGEQIINVLYNGHSSSFTVVVNDYAKDIKITKMPSKVTYKYDEELDLSDMVVSVEMAKEGQKEVTDYEIKGYNKQQLGDQELTISYAGKETTIMINVVNYVADIEITTLPTKLDYIEEEQVDLSGMVVNKVMKDGSKEEISLDDPNLTIQPSTNVVFGDEQIKVVYTTNNTLNDMDVSFEKEYEIKVLKKLSTIELTTEQTTGYTHESFILGTIASGENQVKLEKEQLKVQVMKDSVDVTNDVEIIYSELGVTFDNQIQVKLKMNEVGEYKVIFYIGENINDTNTIKTQEQTITITEDPIVENAELTIESTDKIRVETFIEKEIVFTNKYGDKLENVEAGTIEFVAENVEITKLNNNAPVGSSITPVDGVRIKGQTAGETSIKVIVNKGTKNEKTITLVDSLTILEKAKKEIVIGEVADITLYQEEPLTPKDNVVMYNYDAYTLIPIYIEDEDGNITKLRGTDITMGSATESKKLGISYTGYDPMDPLVQVQLFKDKKPVTSQSEADSVGIALIYGVGTEEMKNKNLQIEYYECESSKVLPIKVEDLRISELIITPENIDSETNLPTGYNHEKVLIGAIKSGDKQKELTVDDLYTNGNANYTVKDESGIDITDKTVEVSYEYDNLRQEVLVYVTTQKEGKYTISSFVSVGENKVATEQEIQTVNHPDVSKVEIQELEPLTVGKPVQKNIKFMNKYDDELIVDSKDVEITASGVNVTFLNVDKGPAGEIGIIELKATEKENVSLTLKINGKELPTINFEIANTTIAIETGGTTSITLYEADPSLDNVKVTDTGLIYTLVPININNDGLIKGIKGNEIILGEATDERPVGITYTGYDALDPYIDVKMFKDGEIIEGGQDADYLGIALFYIEASSMQGKTITINYKDATPANIVVK